jgi:hypothetical protein
MMYVIDSWHRKISTGRHFQNGHHNTAQIQHCPISTTFHMWVDYDVLKWFLTSKNFYRRHFQNGHHNTAQIQHFSISTSWIDSRHWNISTDVHFQNGYHAHLQAVYYNCVKFHLNPMNHLGGVVLTSPSLHTERISEYKLNKIWL